ESPKFIVANTLAMGINVSVNSGMIHLLGGHLLVSLVTAKVATSMFTFWVFKYWVFKHRD
ncbi:MAG: GtrA family protein, partial [Candidatus Omnitrophica bacterium]|nr:GtrA family protein [Candidatus Omnitrophota bacterium]